MRPLKKIISLPALRHNLQYLQHQAGGAELVAVVKANAYGHGVKELLPALQSAAQLAVASIEEAIALRDLGASQPIILLEGLFAPEEAILAAAANFIPCIHEPRQASWLREVKNLRAWLKIDSGMHRLGFLPSEGLEIAKSLPNVDWQGVLSHFSCADDADDSETLRQLQFLEALDLPCGWRRCLANSAAILRFPQSHYDVVRAGLALYGLSPFGSPLPALRPVMTLQSAVLAVRAVKKGEFAGYAKGFQAPAAGHLATIALGYGDGFPRQIDSGAVHLLLNGKKYPLVGKVAMDMALLWLGEDQAAAGDQVIVFGEQNPAEEVARAANTIPYTLTTMLTARPRTEVILADGEK